VIRVCVSPYLARRSDPLEVAERRLEEGMRDPTLTDYERDTVALFFFTRAYRDPADADAAMRRWGSGNAIRDALNEFAAVPPQTNE
jgi:hypothetical protein